MAILTTIEFSKMSGIKIGTIRQHIRRGLLEKDSDEKINTDTEINRRYIEEKTGGKGLGSGVVTLGTPVNKRIVDVVKIKKELGEFKPSKEYLEQQALQIRKATADAERIERDSELKRIQLEKIAGRLLPLELVENIYTVNLQGIFKSFDAELENLASISVQVLGGSREDLANIVSKQRKLLKSLIDKAAKNGELEIENAVNMYSEVRSRGERK